MIDEETVWLAGGTFMIAPIAITRMKPRQPVRVDGCGNEPRIGSADPAFNRFRCDVSLLQLERGERRGGS